MKTLLDFINKHPDVDYGLIKASHISCQGINEKDIFLIYRHTQICPWCQNYMESQLDMEERLKPTQAENQRIVKRIKERMNRSLQDCTTA